MARETQGLQVLLIVFVMLSVVLGVTTFLYTKRADEATQDAKVARLDKQQAEHEKNATEEENKVLKTLIGMPDRSTAEIRKQFDEDVQTYGNQKKPDAATDTASVTKPPFDHDTLHYRNLVEGMGKVVQDRSDELIQAKASLADLQKIFGSREAAKDEQINALLAGYGKLDDLVRKITGDSKSGQQATAAEIAQFVKQMEDIKRNAFAAVAKAAEVEAATKRALQDEERKSRELKERLGRYSATWRVLQPGGGGSGLYGARGS